MVPSPSPLTTPPCRSKAQVRAGRVSGAISWLCPPHPGPDMGRPTTSVNRTTAIVRTISPTSEAVRRLGARCYRARGAGRYPGPAQAGRGPGPRPRLARRALLPWRAQHGPANGRPNHLPPRPDRLAKGDRKPQIWAVPRLQKPSAVPASTRCSARPGRDESVKGLGDPVEEWDEGQAVRHGGG